MENKYVEYNGNIYIFDKKYNYDDIYTLLKNIDIKNIYKLCRMRKNIKELKCEYNEETMNIINKLKN